MLYFVPYGPSKGLYNLRSFLNKNLKIKSRLGFSDLVKNRVIFWGKSIKEFNGLNSYLNNPSKIFIASNKLKTFEVFLKEGIPHPEWTTNIKVAYSWCKPEPHEYEIAGFTRTLLRSHSGKGIEPFYHACDYTIEGEVFPKASLYVKYIKKSKEFRVHVFNKEVIDVQEKRKNRNFQGERDYKVRSHNRGWVFCRQDIQLPQGISDLAIQATTTLGLDFGAVDIIWNKREDKLYVLEVNTAPGLEGTTIINYGNAIKKWLENDS